MAGVGIITGSTADLSVEILSKYRIHVVPSVVNVADRTFEDGVDLDALAFFELVEQTGQLPKTAVPSLGAFGQAYQRHEESIYIGISSQLSGSIQIARAAADECEGYDVRVIDSLNLSTGIGLQVFGAACCASPLSSKCAAMAPWVSRPRPGESGAKPSGPCLTISWPHCPASIGAVYS